MKKEVFLAIFLLVSLFFLVFPIASAQVILNEIMPHTTNSWHNEWVELYNPSGNTLNLNLWKIRDNSSYDNFSLIIYPNSFALIVDNNNYNGSLLGCNAFDIFPESCAELANIGSGLNDDWDNLTLYDSNFSFIDNFVWDENIKDSGKSWARNASSSWQICIPTPGETNNCPEPPNPRIELLFPAYIVRNNVFAVLMNVSDYDDGFYDIKIDIFNASNSSQRISKIWDPQEQEWKSTNYYLYGLLNINNSNGNYLSFLNIEDYLGPALIYSKIRKSGSFTPKENPITYLTNIVDFSQQQQNQTNQSNPTSSSSISIEKAPEEATFGDIINVKLNIYRGDTSKYAVYARIEKQSNGYDVSDETTLHVLTKYVNYSVEIPIQLKPNCDERYDNETYDIVIEGLNITIKQKIKIDGKSKLCPESTEQLKKESEKEKNENVDNTTMESTIKENISSSQQNNFVTGDIINSKQDITLKITPYLLSLLCLLISFYAIKEKIW